MTQVYPEERSPLGPKPAIVGVKSTESPGPGPEVMTASSLDGDLVINERGDELGKIKEIMIDVPNGRVAYAVLSAGGLLGIGDKLFAVPWTAMTLDIDRRCFVLDVDIDWLKRAPGFDKSHWPATADSGWVGGTRAP